MDHLAPKESIAEKVLKIQNDSVLKLDEMAEKLSVIGYDREVQVEGPGQFAVRGGILDIYPLTEELPVRIELWGEPSVDRKSDGYCNLSGGRIPTEW